MFGHLDPYRRLQIREGSSSQGRPDKGSGTNSERFEARLHKRSQLFKPRESPHVYEAVAIHLRAYITVKTKFLRLYRGESSGLERAFLLNAKRR